MPFIPFEEFWFIVWIPYWKFWSSLVLIPEELSTEILHGISICSLRSSSEGKIEYQCNV
jgi:hypothetical protein